MDSHNRPLRVFLCHSSNDKPAVRELYQKLRAHTWIQPWLDEEELYPGQDWNLEIEKAVEAADVIIVCLSKGSTTKEGYVQREIRIALDYADYKPEGTLYIIPVRLEECEPPRRLRVRQYADYFEGQRERGLQRLLVSLKRRANALDLKYESPIASEEMDDEKWLEKIATEDSKRFGEIPVVGPAKVIVESSEAYDKLDLKFDERVRNKIILSNDMEFMRVPAGEFLMGSKPGKKFSNKDEKPQHTLNIPYDYWMARFPVINESYNGYLQSKGIEHAVRDWKAKKDHPVTDVGWTDAIVFCQWLNSLFKNELPSDLALRLPTEAEWEKAARGPDGREYPWGAEFNKYKCNTSEGRMGGTTPVDFYSPRGDSPYGCADMAGNVWEWTHSLPKGYPYILNDGREDEATSGRRVLRGGSFRDFSGSARCADRGFIRASNNGNFGFRVVVAPEISHS